jgi:hypothetical protein
LRTEFYITLFLIAFLGFAAANVGLFVARGIESAQLEFAPFSEQEALEKLSSSEWFFAGALTAVIISILLLAVAVATKLCGRSPVPQAPKNIVTWNIRAIVKSIVIVIFLYVVAFWAIFALAQRYPTLTRYPAMGILAETALKILICFWIYIMLRSEYKANRASMGIHLRDIGRALLYSLLGYISVLFIIYAAGLAWSSLGHYLRIEEESNPVVRLLLTERSRPAILTILFAVVVVTPLTEEFYFRVLTFCALRKSFGFWAGAVVSSLYFSLIHRNFYSIVPIFILGVFLAYIYERTQNFASVVFVHALHNGILVSLILSVR